MKELLQKIELIGDEIRLGGGKKEIEKLHSKKKLHCRERIELLIDKDSDFLEIGLLPDGDFAGGSMSEVIDVNTGKLDAADRKAIATYLKSLPPLPSAAE